jgi:hypothetical protein
MVNSATIQQTETVLYENLISNADHYTLYTMLKPGYVQWIRHTAPYAYKSSLSAPTPSPSSSDEKLRKCAGR